jgi:hypothetical protein
VFARFTKIRQGASTVAYYGSVAVEATQKTGAGTRFLGELIKFPFLTFFQKGKEGAMASFRILIPYNYSSNDQKAIRFAIDAFSGEGKNRFTLFHAYTPLPDVDVTANPENVKLRSGMTFLAGELKEKENALKGLADHLKENGIDDEAVNCVFKKRVKSAAEEIVDAVSGHNVLVLSRGGGKVTHFFTRSIYARVVAALKGVTICVAT